MGVYNVNTCKNYPGDDCLLISGVLGGSTPQGRRFPSTKGAKIGKKGGFRGVENLENFEKNEKRGFLQR